MSSQNKKSQFAPQLDTLEAREVPAVMAVFNTSTLSVVGDSAANSIVVSADTAGNLQVNQQRDGGQNHDNGRYREQANLSNVFVDAKGGDDSINLDRSLNVLDANGKLASAPSGVLSGGGGNDSISSSIGGFVGGVVGNPVVGNLVMDGGAGDDFLNSGLGSDVMARRRWERHHAVAARHAERHVRRRWRQRHRGCCWQRQQPGRRVPAWTPTRPPAARCSSAPTSYRSRSASPPPRTW